MHIKKISKRSLNMCINCELSNAAKYGNLSKFIQLCDIGADIHANNNEVLYMASKYGKLKIIKFLIKVGVNIHTKNDKALLMASYNNHLNVIKYFVNEANFHTWNKDIIHSIIENKNINKNIIKYLKYLPISIILIRISACYKIQNWFKNKLYNPESNYVKTDIKPRFESMQIY